MHCKQMSKKEVKYLGHIASVARIKSRVPFVSYMYSSICQRKSWEGVVYRSGGVVLKVGVAPQIFAAHNPPL